MSNKPKIYSYCPAGCKWETVHKADFLRSATFYEVGQPDGYAVGDAYRKYRIYSDSDTNTGKYIATIEFQSPDASGENFETQNTFTIPVGYRNYFDFEVLQAVYNGAMLRLVYEVNGNTDVLNINLPTTEHDLTKSILKINGASQVLIYNDTAEMLGNDGGYYVPSINDNGDGTATITFEASDEKMPQINPVTFPIGIGDDGKSAYEIYLDNGGTIGSEAEWIVSLNGENGESFYDMCVKNGFVGSETDLIIAMRGENGKSAYAYAQDGGYAGTEEEFAEDLAKIAGTETGESEMVLSANMFDKSTVISGYVWYRSSAATTKVAQINSFIAYVELRGAGTYKFHMPYNFVGDDAYAKRVPLFKADKSFLKNLTSTYLDTSDNLAYLVEVVISESDINEGAVYLAYDGYEPYINRLMVVKNMEYPSTYIPYGYIEVSTDSGESVNVLTGKTAVFLGDSICAGTTVEGEYKGYGWAGLIGEANKMNWTNYGKNGGTITDLDSVASGLWLSKQADKAIAENPTADYVIFEGGCNDSDLMKEAGLGAISADYSTFDTTTFSGAFESLVLKLVTAYPNAKIGYIIPQKMYTGFADFTAEKHRHRLYFDRAVEICRKWGIPVVDLWHGSTLNPKLSNASTYYTDSQHLTLAGYQKITPLIEAWMKDMYVTGSAPTNSGGSGIDVTAEVGQTIVVKAVDENGKPTAWESADYQPRTHWVETVETIMPETTLDYNDEEGAFLSLCDAEFPTRGDLLEVTYNGTKYLCRPMVEDEAVTFGYDIEVNSGRDKHIPFYAGIANGMVLLVPLDGAEKVILSISKVIVHPIAEYFLANGRYEVNYADLEIGENGIAERNYDDILRALFEGREVVFTQYGSTMAMEIKVLYWEWHQETGLYVTIAHQSGATVSLLFKNGTWTPTE